jgi:hypothetical protein
MGSMLVPRTTAVDAEGRLMAVTVKRLRTLVKSFPWDEWNQELEEGLMQEYRDLVKIEGIKAADAAGVEFNLDDPSSSST